MTGLLGSDPITYDRARELAKTADPTVRAELAGREDIPPEILYFLAEDGNPDVRRAVAENQAAPRQTDLILAKDDNEHVRGGLASKIAQVAPGLSAEETNKVRSQTYEALETLATDQITQVRAILSDALKDVVDAPADVIKTLAGDLEIEVSGPVLEFSPVLSDDDLKEIIERGPATGAISAIARRETVSEDLSDIIVGTDDVDGIAELLGNDSAQIREEVLDDLIERSESVELWQAPLVTRPQLPDGAAARMAGFIAENLLDALRQRSDLDGESLDAVSDIVRERVGAGPNDDIKKALSAGFDFLKVDPPIDAAQRLYSTGKLSDAVVKKALQAGDHTFVYAALIVRSGVDVSVARKIFLEKSPQGVAALIGKAKLPSSMLVLTQQKMARIAPSQIVEPPENDAGDFPLNEEEIDWQIEFYADMVNKAQ